MSAGNTSVKGFTLIELLVSIVVLVVVVTLAVPSFQDIFIRNRLAADYNEVLSAVNFARSEAVKRREKVTLVVASDDDGVGWIVEVWLDDGMGDIDCPSHPGCLQVRDKSDSSVVIESYGDGRFTFNSLGRLSASTPLDFEISNGGVYMKCFTFELSGIVTSAEGGCGGT